MVRQHQISDAQLRIGESRDSGFDAAHRPGTTKERQVAKKPAVISDGRPVFGMQQVLRPQWTQTLTEVEWMEEALKTP